MKSRRELLLLTAGAAGLAGCSTGGRSGVSTSTATETPSDTATPTPTETTTEEPTQTKTEEPENQEWKNEVRNGVPLNGLGAYTDQVLEAGPVRETKVREIERILEESGSLDEEIDALTQELTNEEFDSYMAEYHRQKNHTENQVVVNKNWSFTSDSEPILELYKVTDGNLQNQPVILDHDPHYHSRNINKPGTGEPQYLAHIRDSTDWAQTVPQDWKAEQDLRNSFEDWTDAEKRSRRESTQRFWSNGLFGIGKQAEVIPYDAESSMVLFNGMYQDGDTQAVVELNNEYRDSEIFGSDNLVSAEYTGNGWDFRKHEEREIGDPLPGEDDFFELVE